MNILSISRSRYVDLRTPHLFSMLIKWKAEAWQVTIGILQSDADAEAKLFAATTLRGKVRFRSLAMYPWKLTPLDHI